MNNDELLAPVIAAAAAAIPRNEEYYLKDGLLYCGRCHTPKQYRITPPGETEPIVVFCMCDCLQAEYEQEQKDKARRERLAEINRLRISGINDPAARNHRFESAEMTPELQKCKRYADKWPEMRKGNIGLLLFGGVGTGKSFAAACVANAVLDRELPVLFTSIPMIISGLTGMFKEDRVSYINSLSRFSLVVIDDLGAERETEFAREVMFDIIDVRYKSGKPLIVTTNLALKDLKEPGSLDLARIYDRILEMCVPIKFAGGSRREAARKQKTAWARALLEGDTHDEK